MLSELYPFILNQSKKLTSKTNLDYEDIAQDVCVKIQKTLPRFKEVTEEESKKLVTSIIRNHTIDSIRKKKPYLFADLGIDYTEMEIEPTQHLKVECAYLRKEIKMWCSKREPNVKQMMNHLLKEDCLGVLPVTRLRKTYKVSHQKWNEVKSDLKNHLNSTGHLLSRRTVETLRFSA